MKVLHIVQGGVDNGDKELLERVSKTKRNINSWVVPKTVKIGDEVVIYVLGYGFFATAVIDSSPVPHPNWKNRYKTKLTSIKLIKPAISIGTIRSEIPKLKWTKYPRSIATPEEKVAKQIKTLITHRRKTGLPKLDDASLEEANIDELRKVALLRAKTSIPPKKREAIYRASSRAITLLVLKRANGHCEGCKQRGCS